MQEQIDSLRRVRASSFDSAFVHKQIASNQLMLEYIQQLVPASQHPELQSMLSAAAKRVASQLDRARSLDSTLVARPD
jgi:predicted outer membrane protein